MSLEQFAVTTQDLDGVGVMGLPDVPALSTAEMQAKLEQTTREVVIPHFNAVLQQLETELQQRPLQTEVTQQIDQQVQAVGAGDMAKSVYDPQGKNSDVFAVASGTASGMVSLSDAADSTSSVSDGVAATPAAVKAAKDAAGAAQTAADNAQTTADAAMPKAGGQFTGNAAAYNTNTTTARLRNAIVQNSSGTAQSTNYIKFVRK